MSEIQCHLRAFCDYSLVFKGNTPRAVDTYRREISAFLKTVTAQHPQEITLQLIESYLLAGKLEKHYAVHLKNPLDGLSMFAKLGQSKTKIRGELLAIP